ncbi:hypothetical protein ACR9JV_07670 [Helicobacter pylori]
MLVFSSGLPLANDRPFTARRVDRDFSRGWIVCKLSTLLAFLMS